MSSQIIRVPALLTELDVPAPSASLYLRRNAGNTAYEWAAVTVPSTLDDLSDVTVTGVAQGAVLYRNASAWVHLPAGTSGQALLSGGAGADVAWGAAGVTDHGGLTGLVGTDHHTGYALLAPGSSARNVIQATAGGFIPLTVKLFSGATTDMQHWQNAAGVWQSRVRWDGSVEAPGFVHTINGGSFYILANMSFRDAAGSHRMLYLSNASPNVMVDASSAAAVPFRVRLAASHSASALEINTSAGSGGDVLQVTPGGILALRQTNSQLYFGAGGANIKLGGGGTFTIQDNASQTLATFVSNGGGTLRNAGTTRIEWNATGIGFFAVTPVARPTALTAADAGALNTGDAGSDAVIGNMRTRIGELETKLQSLGLLT